MRRPLIVTTTSRSTSAISERRQPRCHSDAGVRIGIDPLGGAGVHYWGPIIDRYRIKATVVNDAVDPTFRFMSVDSDGKIRMDCSWPLCDGAAGRYEGSLEFAFANDTDNDRHGIVTPSAGLMNPIITSR